MPEITTFPGASGYDAKGVPTIPATFPVDPAPQFRAAWLHIAKMSNRVVGTTVERSAAATWAWEGLAFYDTTEKREYVRSGAAWQRSGWRTVTTIATFGTGWTGLTGNHVPRIIEVNGQFSLVGLVGRTTVAGLFTDILTIPVDLRPAAGTTQMLGTFVAQGGLSGQLSLQPDGKVRLEYSAGSPPAAVNVTLSGTWERP